MPLPVAQVAVDVPAPAPALSQDEEAKARLGEALSGLYAARSAPVLETARATTKAVDDIESSYWRFGAQSPFMATPIRELREAAAGLDNDFRYDLANALAAYERNPDMKSFEFRDTARTLKKIETLANRLRSYSPQRDMREKTDAILHAVRSARSGLEIS